MHGDKGSSGNVAGLPAKEAVLLDTDVLPATEVSAWLWDPSGAYLFLSASLCSSFLWFHRLPLESRLSGLDLKSEGLGKSSSATYCL